MAELVSVERLNSPGEVVYNLEVEDDHSYIAEGVVVHNCDLLATQDAYGYGPGMYPPDKWPIAGHAHCGCVQGGPMKFRRPSEWGKPKPASNPLAIDPTDAQHTAAFAARWTDRERERYQNQFAAILAEGERTRVRRAA